jgi:hypothetical protein
MNRLPAFLIILIACISTLFGQRLQKYHRQDYVAGWKFMDINSVYATLSYDGVFADYLKTNGPGLFWPIGTKTTPVYTSGLWVIGKHRPSDSLRTAVMNYRSEFQPGKILTTFNSTTLANSADDPSKPEYRLYKITRGMPDEDYENWPVQLGAPFNDVNSNNTWDPGIDSPLRWGDQQLWTVSNDLNPSNHNLTGLTSPMGIELQSTFFGYDVPGALGNTVFIRYKIINKSDADYDSVYIGYWSDIDLGAANDDMIGSDTVRNMFYVYNSDNDDNYEGSLTGYGSTPPATGFVLLQGPAVSTGHLTDTALVEGKKRAGYMNQNISSFTTYLAGGGGLNWVDPPLGNSNFSLYAFRNFRGLAGPNGLPFTDPETNKQTPFVFAGDPVTGSGWIQSKTTTAQDMRGFIGSGPFTLAQNDTQEVVIAYVIARGENRLASITLLRNYVDEVRSTFIGNFTAPKLVRDGPKMYVEHDANVYSFNKLEIGNSGDTLKFSFSNIGNETLVVHQEGLTNPAFVKVTPESTVINIQPGSHASLKLYFKPIQPGLASDSIVFTTNDTSKPRYVVYVSGAGVQVQPAISGIIYASNDNSLYSLASSNGSATLISNTEYLGLKGFAVNPTTKELIGITYNRMIRIDANSGAYLELPIAMSRYSISGGLSFLNDSMAVFGADSIIARLNFNTGEIDTVHRFYDKYRVRSLSYNALTNEIYFTIHSLFNTPDTADAIYKLDVSTKAITRVGRTKFNTRPLALLFDKNGKLYGISTSGSTPYLIDINTSTGVGTIIGPTGTNFIFALAMDPSSPAGIVKQNSESPKSYSLMQNFPNPFNPATTITYYLPALSPVRLVLYDLLGRARAVLVDELQEPGEHRYRLDIAAMNLSSGVYFYRLQSGSFTDVKKMSVLK